jgi:hypothetical protein
MLLLALLAATTSRIDAQTPTGSLVWKWETVICYNDQGAVIERLTQSFENNGLAVSQLIEKKTGSDWVNDTRVSYTNDIYGRLITALTELWQSGAWVNFTRVSVTYDAAGQIILESVEKNQGGSWVNYVRRSYGYDGLGRKMSMLQQRWIGAVWENDLRTTYDYTANVITVLTEYSDDGNPWQVGGRFTYSCDLNGNYVELLMESWEEEQWQNGAKVEYTNDPEGNILTEWGYDPFGNGWVSSSRKIYTYDNNGNALTGKTEQYSAGDWLPEVATSYIYHKKEYILVLNVPVYRYEATYRGFPLGMEEKPSLYFSVYPNPAKDFITIDGLRENNAAQVVYLTDNLGKPVKKLNLDQNQMQLDVSGLTNGLYMLTVRTKEGSATRKLIIQKP